MKSFESRSNLDKKITLMLMCEPMIRAYRENRKSQTRRLRGLEKINAAPDDWFYLGKGSASEFMFQNKDRSILSLKCPYGGAGDGLMFKETFLLPEHVQGIPKNPVPVWYCVDGIPTWGSWTKKKSSMFMPYWAIRNYPDIFNVRPERLLDILEGDAQEEGVKRAYQAIEKRGGKTDIFYIESEEGTYTEGFIAQWDALNGASYPSSVNPWVWVIKFEDYEFTFDAYEADLYHYKELVHHE